MSRRIFAPALHSILSNAGRCGCLGDFSYHANYADYKIDEDDKNYHIEMDMPGVRKEDLDIGIKENILSISAERKKAVKTESGDLKEETVSSYEQSFNINSKGIDIENIEADLNNGVLKVTLPKKEELKYERKIEIKGA
ncbi:Hsp20/alpha crystallin family protein [uncultured Brachyspira sp.]|uniref:Hsp20/alpha crystallin family protein n=1 Tax=uncultured Brachyspira sp. TaxID=221953 RepID=UPI0025D147D4|nr:Hsp20/alpha crystallin family protein [uncultured Brachyspira sp.]